MKRKYSIDILRVLAASAVLLFHVVGSFVNNDPMASASAQKYAAACCSALSWHVPVFFMITGFLWLGQDKACTYPKMWRNIRRFLLVLFTVGFTYAFMEQFFSVRQFSGGMLLRSFGAVLTGDLWDHMWYLYTAVGIYLILPAIKPFFDHGTKQALAIFTGILFVFTVICPAVADNFGYSFPVQFPMVAPMFFVCAGGLIAKLQIKEKYFGYVGTAVFICAIIVTILIKLYWPEFDGILSILGSINTISLFLAITVFFSEAKEMPRLFDLSDCTFGVYLFHPFFINLLIKALGIYPARFLPPVGLLLAFLGIWILSFAVTHVLRKVTLIKKYLL